jgi:hypothetical protein
MTTLTPTDLTPTELTQSVRLGLSRATLALLDGDERLAELAARNDAAFSAATPDDAMWVGAANLKLIGTVTVQLAEAARKRAPKRTVPDRLHSIFRSMAREADSLIETAVTGRSVDPTAMHQLIDDLLRRVQSDTRQFTAKEARRAINLGQFYAAIADHTVAMSGSRSASLERWVA